MKTSRLVIIYLVLVVLLALTVSVAHLPVVPALKGASGLTVAVAKALLVALFFMNLRIERGVVRIFAFGGLFTLILLLTLTLSDYLTR